MKLLFLDCQISKDLKEALAENRIAFETQSATSVPSTPDFALVICRIGPADKSLSVLKDLKRQHPHSWMVLIVEDHWLKEPSLYQLLLASAEKDDVWLASSWENSFWMNLQRAVQNRASRLREQLLQKELEQIKLAQEALIASSTALVEKMEKSAALTLEAHRKLTPRFSPDVAGVEVLSKYVPASGPGGDYFDLFEYGDKRRFGFLLADSQTHQAAASLLSALLAVRLDELRARFTDSSTFVQHLGQAVATSRSVAGISLLYGVFDRASLEIDLCCAGQWPVWLWRDGDWSLVPVNANPELTSAAQEEWRRTQISLKAGDTVFLFSDGFQKRFQSRKEGVPGILKAIRDSKSPAEARNRLLAEIALEGERSEPQDDLTLLFICIDSKAHALRPIAKLVHSK
jgi:serine phosphatase RsbU (regulator of sigma subunit)